MAPQMNVSASEFAAMSEEQRATITFEVLANMCEAIEGIRTKLEELADTVSDGKVEDEKTSSRINEARKVADDALASARAAHRRLDKIMWAVAATSLGALLSLVLALVTFLLQKGLGG
jgi:hypothetical protein